MTETTHTNAPIHYQHPVYPDKPALRFLPWAPGMRAECVVGGRRDVAPALLPPLRQPRAKRSPLCSPYPQLSLDMRKKWLGSQSAAGAGRSASRVGGAWEPVYAARRWRCRPRPPGGRGPLAESEARVS
ncbi:hypothetical protein P7K49_026990 [Saguinus oedipus]|uniref:Uncharacterized protein n=1 Tax=Saguinus oedipus TaxID=9490 RepID=A0ABQ9UFL3_SAGOE|nr:hypothetical protein P7K49_026990 [Saguinus oedipus]